MRVPTKRANEEFDKQEFAPSTKTFGFAVFRKSPGYNCKFIVDFREINKQVGAKRKKGAYSPAMLGIIRDQITKAPFVKIYRKYAAHVYEISIIPFDTASDSQYISSDLGCKNTPQFSEVEPKKLKTESPEGKSQSQDSKTVSGNQDRKILIEQQQHLIAIKSLVTKAGFNFLPDIFYKLAQYSARAIARSIEYVQIQISSGKVRNPEGYLLHCLEKGYWKCLDVNTEVSKSYWQKVVNNFRNAAICLSQKFEQLPEIDLDNFEGWGDTRAKIANLIDLLGEEYYGDELISSVIALNDNICPKKKKKRSAMLHSAN